MRRFLFTIASIALLIVAYQNCEMQTNMNQQIQGDMDFYMQELKSAIHLDCSQNSDCAQVEVGSKPCGGPQMYMIYSTMNSSPAEIVSLADQYSKMEERFNQLNEVYGTCDLVMPYNNLKCVNSKCIGQDSRYLGPPEVAN